MLSSIFNGTSYSVAGCYLALFTVSPTKSGGGTEVSTAGTAYVRQLIAPVTSGGLLVESQTGTGSLISFATIAYPAATGSGFGTIVAVGVFDAVSGGNMLYFGTVSNVTIGVGVVYDFVAGNLTVEEG